MKLICYFISLIFVASVFQGCDKFLDVKPKGIVIPEKAEEYRLMLNSSEMTAYFPALLLQVTDDYYGDFNSLTNSAPANMYFWRANLDQDLMAEPKIWGNLYSTIYHANVIINNVMDAKEGTLAERRAIEAEALLVRADCYFILLTVFAKAYDVATARVDPGLPLTVNTNVTDKTPPRASVQVTFDTLINGVTRAISSLPEKNTDKAHPTKCAAYSLLARFSLYMQRWDDAKKYAGLALSDTFKLANYNDYKGISTLSGPPVNSEIIWHRSGFDFFAPYDMICQEGLLNIYEAGDIRFRFFIAESYRTAGYKEYNPTYGVFNVGTSFPEMYLIKAECLARKGQVDACLDVLNEFRRYRIDTAFYKPLTAADKEEALTKVLAERRRELAFRGQRWTDMKRLDREGRMPPVERKQRSTGVVDVVLKPHGKGYVFQIPGRVVQFNPDMQLNER